MCVHVKNKIKKSNHISVLKIGLDQRSGRFDSVYGLKPVRYVVDTGCTGFSDRFRCNVKTGRLAKYRPVSWITRFVHTQFYASFKSPSLTRYNSISASPTPAATATATASPDIDIATIVHPTHSSSSSSLAIVAYPLLPTAAPSAPCRLPHAILHLP